MRRIAFAFVLFLSSCCHVNSSFTPDLPISIQSKRGLEEVAYLSKKPGNASLRIGLIASRGNGGTTFRDLVEDARKKAAELGGDFILEEKSGVDVSTVHSPGYTTFEADAHESREKRSGHGTSKTKAYSVAPSVTTVHHPWSRFSVWVYSPSQLGIRFDEDHLITGFHLNSNAERRGIQEGDKILGIDGADVLEPNFVRRLLSIQPNDEVRVTLQRGAERLDCWITALPN